MGRPVKEKSLTQRDVVEAAIACVEAEGEAALGVNRVARELGITPRPRSTSMLRMVRPCDDWWR